MSPDGSTVFVTGYINTNTGNTGAVLAYSAATGALLWQKTGPISILGARPVKLRPVMMSFEVWTPCALCSMSDVTESADFYEVASLTLRAPVKVSPDGSTVYVTGGTAAAGSTGETETYNATTGAVEWKKPQGGDAIAISANGSRLYITGEPSGSTSKATPITRAFNAATGATVWKTNAGPDATLTAAKFSPHGNVLYVGEFIADGAAGGTDNGTLKTVAYNAVTGAKLWQASTGTETVSDYYQADVDGLAVTPSGSALIVSEYLNNGPVGGLSAISVSSNGSQIFVTGSQDADEDIMVTYAYGV